MTTAERALYACRGILENSVATPESDPLLFRACMCANGWQAACAGIVAAERPRTAVLPGRPLVPLYAVLVIIFVGILGLVYAYRNRSRLQEQAESRERRRTTQSWALRAAATGQHEAPPDLPPPYSAVTPEPPPSYESICAAEDAAKRGGGV